MVIPIMCIVRMMYIEVNISVYSLIEHWMYTLNIFSTNHETTYQWPDTIGLIEAILGLFFFNLPRDEMKLYISTHNTCSQNYTLIPLDYTLTIHQTIH